MIDGMVARKRKEVSEFGKLYDPFADTLTQITYFFCFQNRNNATLNILYYLCWTSNIINYNIIPQCKTIVA